VKRLFFLPPLAAALLATSALGGGPSVTVQVGATTTLDVGLAKGLNCDDLSVADVQIRNRSKETNELVITGLKPGRTACRAGTATSGATVLVAIQVVEKTE